MVLVVSGVSGIGKTTVGRLLAKRLGYSFAEGDDYHPAANVEKMRSGHPLDDADRVPWLEALSAQIERWLAEGVDAVLACSALKRAHRRVLAGEDRDVCFVHLSAELEVVRRRIEARSFHFMPADLLDSQFEALEVPGRDERAVVVPATGTPAEIVDRIVARLAEAPRRTG
jgi:gluconokinase